ncbi:MAG: glutamate synthase large subunit [Proteobacteria bacterium]|nr:glutamate synthase large subunit [Pseudomonadota bacterium]
MKEFDSCGVGFVCNLKNIYSNEILRYGITAVKNLTHRGAVGADGKSGDGCGILFEIPKNFFKKILMEKKNYSSDKEIALGVLFCKDRFNMNDISDILSEFGFSNIYFRDVPVNIDALGAEALKTMPLIKQVIFQYDKSDEDVEKKLFLIKRIAEKKLPGIHIASLSSKIIIYKALVIAPYLDIFYPDLLNRDLVTRFCIFHQRYSTNTKPSWEMVQPFQYLAHNGEINTIKGNRFQISAIEEKLEHALIDKYKKNLFPLLNDYESDSRSLDTIFGLLTNFGYSPDLAINLLIPPAWEGIPFVDSKLKNFFQYNELIASPWDGPAAIVYTDGDTLGAHLDRNGLRPIRYSVYEDGVLIAGSETGLININSKLVKRGKLGSGDTISIKLDKGYLKSRMEVLNEIISSLDNQKYLKKLYVIDRKDAESGEVNTDLIWKLVAFGYTEEEVQKIIPYSAKEGKELIFSMGDDTPIPPLMENPPLIFRYFKQKFAQVTNPPIDPLREHLVMSLSTYLGSSGNLLDYKDEKHGTKIKLSSPILSADELENIKNFSGFNVKEISTIYGKDLDLRSAIERLRLVVIDEVKKGRNIIILTDKNIKKGANYIPSLLAVSSLITILDSEKLLSEVSIIVETGEVRDSHQCACLIAFGASAIHPYIAYSLCADGSAELFRIALEHGLRKIISKMGISCISSYRGSRLFDAVCLNKDLIDNYFAGVDYSLEAHGLEDIEMNYRKYIELSEKDEVKLPIGGDLKFKKDGEWHAWSPNLVRAIQVFIKEKTYSAYKSYAQIADEGRKTFIRHLFNLPDKKPIPIQEVEAEEEIIKRFVMGGMSLGALSPEAHETIISACNELGIKSNTGEGGENPEFYFTNRGALIKQVASGRFGVTPTYLASAKEIEIKIAQGAKPGEGGQLPGHKVNNYIALLRHSQPGITLISPPPHHDIYSIEDLAQLINDLKNVNPEARVCVKLVSEKGIGQIACGVAKADADIIHISSVDGGTGASPYLSIKNAGNYWEIGLSEAHLSLCENGLREKVTLRVDGGFKTGRDIVISALLGAEEYGFGTLLMLAGGCIMARQCHLNTCPTGIATQDEELRKRFKGKKDDIKAFFYAIASHVREILAELGYRSLNEIIGKGYLLKKCDEKSYYNIKVEQIFERYDVKHSVVSKAVINQTKGNELNLRILKDIESSILENKSVVKYYKIKNTDRSVPLRLNYLVSKVYKNAGLEEDKIKILFEGIAGQSFGAFNHKGVSLYLRGEANDYVGKGMFGGRIVIYPNDDVPTHKNYLAGNTILYGATGGELFIAGRVGERFAVRNSGANAVIEGAGHHLCEYMTGGTIVVLGGVGLNIGAGMTGGVIYIFDELDNLDFRINKSYVKIVTINEKDIKIINQFLEKHFFYTESKRAKYLIDEFKNIISSFKKVIPI